jgi:hypothetical protein
VQVDGYVAYVSDPAAAPPEFLRACAAYMRVFDEGMRKWLRGDPEELGRGLQKQLEQADHTLSRLAASRDLALSLLGRQLHAYERSVIRQLGGGKALSAKRMATATGYSYGYLRRVLPLMEGSGLLSRVRGKGLRLTVRGEMLYRERFEKKGQK